MLVFLFGVVFYFAIGSQANDNKAEFEVFLKKYNLTYDDAEYSRRFGIFTANLKRIENAKAGGAKGLGINRFADWDPEEFTQQVSNPHLERGRDCGVCLLVKTDALPSDGNSFSLTAS